MKPGSRSGAPRWLRPVPILVSLAVVGLAPLATAAEDAATVSEAKTAAAAATGEPAPPQRVRIQPDQPLAEQFWEPIEDSPERGLFSPWRYLFQLDGAAAGDPSCRGRYRFPPPTLPPAVDQSTLPVEAEAQRGSYQIGAAAELTGEVRLVQGDRVLEAPAANIDLATGQAAFTGSVTVVEPSTILRGASAEVDLNTQASDLREVEMLMHPAQFRGTAARVQVAEDRSLTVTDGLLTRCPPGNNSWRVSAGRLEIEEGAGYAVVRRGLLRVGRVPVFYAPYLRFPVTDARQSGWLFPNMGYSQEDGVDLAVPYYFNLAPNYDLILTPRLISERGLGLEAGGRYLNGYGDFGLYGAALPGDDLYNGELERDDFFELNPDGEFEAADRWLYGMTHAGQRELGRGVLRTFVDYTAVSDGDYFRDLGTDLGVSSRIQLERLGEVIYSQGEFEARLWAQRFQVLDGALQKPYERLPELSLRHGGQLPAGLRWAMGAAWASFDRDTRGLSGINAVTGSRLHLTPRLTLPLSWPFGFLTVSAGYNLTRYDLDVDEAGLDSSFDTRPSRDIPFGSVDGSLIFERPLRLFGNAFVQTLEPRLYYLNQDFVDQSDLPNFDSGPLTFQYRQLFRENRFAGIDRIGDANQVSVGITSRLLDAASGREQLRASLGQIRYFEDRRVTLIGAPTEADRQAGSVYVAELSGTLARNFRWQGVGVWDGYTNDVIESSIQIGYQSGPQRILNLGYRTRDEAGVDQSDVSVYWPLTRRFSVLGRWNYDLESGRTIEGLGGIEYNDCCWKIRLLARRFIDSPSVQAINTIEADEGIDLQIVFKGLAGFGNATETVLERSIRGYQPQQ